MKSERVFTRTEMRRALAAAITAFETRIGSGNQAAKEHAEATSRSAAQKTNSHSSPPDVEGTEPRLHELKAWPEYYAPIVDGRKTFEVRKNDRDFQEGDVLLLREWNPRMETYTGNEARFRVTYVLRNYFALDLAHVILGIRPLAAPSRSGEK